MIHVEKHTDELNRQRVATCFHTLGLRPQQLNPLCLRFACDWAGDSALLWGCGFPVQEFLKSTHYSQL